MEGFEPTIQKKRFYRPPQHSNVAASPFDFINFVMKSARC